MKIAYSIYYGRKIKHYFIVLVVIFLLMYTLLIWMQSHNYSIFNYYGMAESKLKLWNDYIYSPIILGKYGENGVAVTEFSRKNYPIEVDSAYRVYGFNQFLSDKISVNRTLPDYRYDSCKKKIYSKKLPPVSVIIVFYDEGISTLKRTVYSVVNRTPPELLYEIILVDDHSTLEHLGKPLDDWVKTFQEKVKILRLKTHDGLITAKNFGAQAAKGEVLVFLDSHCEATIGWLQPLLDPITTNYRVVTAPIIDVIHHDTFEYSPIYNRVRGTFSWLFYYKERNEKIITKKIMDNENIRSPVMAGGLFAISKKWWHEIGEYDPGLYVWGGEQYEISFKIWMCGGTLLNVPCSHVGHVYRGPGLIRNHQNIHSRHPNSLMTNYKRVAEVWMDEYKNFLYMNHRSIASANVGENIDSRKKLRRSLKCKNFQWYLKNVVTDTLYTRYEPDLGYGIVTDILSNNQMCICNNGLNNPLSYGMCDSCQNIWRYTWIGEFKEDEHCWDYDSNTHSIYNRFCHENRGNQYFHYDIHLKVIKAASYDNKCVVVSKINSNILTLLSCDDDSDDLNIKYWHINLIDNTKVPLWANLALHPPRNH